MTPYAHTLNTQLFLLLVSFQSEDQAELPPAFPNLDGDAKESTRQVGENQPAVVSDESGRSLAVTLHEVYRFYIFGFVSLVYVPSDEHIQV